MEVEVERGAQHLVKHHGLSQPRHGINTLQKNPKLMMFLRKGKKIGAVGDHFSWEKRDEALGRKTEGNHSCALQMATATSHSIFPAVHLQLSQENGVFHKMPEFLSQIIILSLKHD